jgi:hypothetical protein
MLKVGRQLQGFTAVPISLRSLLFRGIPDTQMRATMDLDLVRRRAVSFKEKTREKEWG